MLYNHIGCKAPLLLHVLIFCESLDYQELLLDDCICHIRIVSESALYSYVFLTLPFFCISVGKFHIRIWFLWFVKLLLDPVQSHVVHFTLIPLCTKSTWSFSEELWLVMKSQRLHINLVSWCCVWTCCFREYLVVDLKLQYKHFTFSSCSACLCLLTWLFFLAS